MQDSSRWAPESKPNNRWIVVWLTCVAFYYPALWLSNSLLWAMPALIRVALLGYRVDNFKLILEGAFASSVPPDVLSGLHPNLRTPNPLSLDMMVPLVLAAVALLVVVGRRRRVLSGLGIAMLGHVALLPWLWRLFLGRQTTAAVIFAFLLYFGVLCFGLRWMLAGWHPLTFWERVGSLVAGFVLLAPLPWPRLDLILHLRFSWRTLSLMAPSAAAALLVSLPPLRPGSSEPERVRWKPVAGGVTLSVLLGVAARQGQRALDRASLTAQQVAMAAYPKIPKKLPYPKLFFQKGVNFTAEGWGGYEAEGARQMLERLPRYGINAVALVPYGFVSRKPLEIHFPGSMETDEGLEMMSRVAHARGMKVLLKPGMWTGGGYAGNLEFSSAEDRAKWFDQYRLFLEHYTRLATEIHADVFCVGGEFAKLSPYDAEWRKLIARAREIYPGPLVYAANHGAEVENITFWDALDYIGLQEYYSLPDDLSTDALVQKVEAVQRKFQRPVIFTEAGFPSLNGANREPWNDHRATNPSPEFQARCYEAVLRAFYHRPWFQGVYWWKVGTNGYGSPQDRSHTPWGKPAMDLVARYYLDGER